MSASVININEALERIGGDKEFLFELLDEFAQQVDENLPLLKKAINDGDFDNIKLIAHSLRGAAGNLSINEMHQALTEIEALVSSRENAKMALFLDKIDAQQSDLRGFLKEQS